MLVTDGQAKAVIDGITTINKRLGRNLSKAKKAISTWDSKTLERALVMLEEDIKQLDTDWEAKRQEIADDIQVKQEFINSGAYTDALENALREAGISFQGKFPNYEFVPFKLVVDTQEGTVRLGVGRKTEKTSALAPQEVAAWVAARYKSLVERRFNQQRICQDLLIAYEMANRMAFQADTVMWGRAVSLSTLYDLLTIRQSSRRDYPRALFNFELGRLKEQVEIRYKNYRFEFGFARNQPRSFIIYDTLGRESRVSSLTIFMEDDK